MGCVWCDVTSAEIVGCLSNFCIFSPHEHNLYVFYMPKNGIIQDHHSATISRRLLILPLPLLSYFWHSRFEYYMSLTCPEVCVLHMCKSAYVLMHTNDSSAWPEPAGSSAAAPSTPLKKTLPDAPTVLQDSERKCQASQKEGQERWWRSPRGRGGFGGAWV